MLHMMHTFIVRFDALAQELQPNKGVFFHIFHNYALFTTCKFPNPAPRRAKVVSKCPKYLPFYAGYFDTHFITITPLGYFSINTWKFILCIFPISLVINFQMSISRLLLVVSAVRIAHWKAHFMLHTIHTFIVTFGALV